MSMDPSSIQSSGGNIAMTGDLRYAKHYLKRDGEPDDIERQ